MHGATVEKKLMFISSLTLKAPPPTRSDML